MKRELIIIFKKILKLWPIRPNEFLPERTFEWNRFVYLIVHGREMLKEQQKTYPNILNDIYLNEILKLEADLPKNVEIQFEKKWQKTLSRNSTNKSPIKFQVKTH